MREPLNDPIRLQHILEATERINEFTSGFSEKEFDVDVMRKHATVYNIQIIGEAAYKLSSEFKQSHPDTPWAVIEKMRHILVHDYYQVNNHIMWLVITEDIPALRAQIQQYIEE